MTSDPARNYPHHGFGCTGDVTAPVIYANYGTEDDFEKVLLTIYGVLRTTMPLCECAARVHFKTIFRWFSVVYGECLVAVLYVGSLARDVLPTLLIFITLDMT